MVHMNVANQEGDKSAHGDGNMVTNFPHQHVFFLVGDETLFGVHMTQYHCEIHKYQLIIRIKIPEEAQAKLRQLRAEYPNDSFILGNAEAGAMPGVEEMTVPDLATGTRSSFLGNIFQGIRPLTEEEQQVPHLFPWNKDRCTAAIPHIPVEIERVVLFRPFVHHDTRPLHPTYYLWGEGDEAHMTNWQTGELASGPFEPEAFGPDYDHIMSLAAAPDWLDKGLLRAGICVSTPSIDMYDTASWSTEDVFPEGNTIQVMYRGIGPARSVTAGPTFLNGSAVCNSPAAFPEAGPYLFMSEMPPNYHVD